MKKPVVIAVVVSVVLHQVLGYLWYAVAPWARTRVLALGLPESELTTVNGAALGMDIVGWILASVMIAWLLQRLGRATVSSGMTLAVALWVGVALPAIAPHYAFAHIPASVMVVDLLNSLVTLIVTGAVLGAGLSREMTAA
ncbi:MAG: DUF1761 domain-containing protein [Gemmatimonadales bacterium]